MKIIKKNKNMKNLIGVSGFLGSGKDLTASIIREESGNDYQIKKFADNLKYICSIISGRPIEDMYTQEGKNIYIKEFDMTVGEMQQKIGTDVFRDNFDKDVWVKSLFSTYKKEDYWIITDVRFPNEAEYIKSLGGIIIRVNGDPANIRKNSTRDLSHPSETSLDDYNFDYVIENNGTIEELENKVIDILNAIEKR